MAPYPMRLAISYKILLAFALALGVALTILLSSRCASGVGEGTEGSTLSTTATLDEERDKIRHVVVIMQENRSFDSYFGTYPGADGLRRTEDGEFTVCVLTHALAVTTSPTMIRR
jgi:phospholipase C